MGVMTGFPFKTQLQVDKEPLHVKSTRNLVVLIAFEVLLYGKQNNKVIEIKTIK
jgi:hypothetical protein